MSEKSKVEKTAIEDNLSDIEETSSPEVETKKEPQEKSTNPEKASPPKKSSNKLPLLLLFISLLTAGYIFAPQPLKDEAIDLFNTLIQAKQTSQPQAPTADTPKTVEVEPVTTKREPIAEIDPPAEPEVISASSDEVNRMLEAMNQLQTELTSLRQRQQKVEAQQHAVQRMQLRARLRWITNPANHLPQIQLAWEEISLMPILTADERQQAETMLALAEKNKLELQKWQQILQSHAEALGTKKHENIMPAFENRWLNWVAEKFSIRHSLSEQEAENAKLREALLNTSRNLETEQWPDSKTWLQLRSTLQLRIVAAAESTEAKLELPESFDAIRKDMEQLRQTAAVWMEQLP